jgi:hypothetical protein
MAEATSGEAHALLDSRKYTQVPIDAFATTATSPNQPGTEGEDCSVVWIVTDEEVRAVIVLSSSMLRALFWRKRCSQHGYSFKSQQI